MKIFGFYSSNFQNFLMFHLYGAPISMSAQRPPKFECYLIASDKAGGKYLQQLVGDMFGSEDRSQGGQDLFEGTVTLQSQGTSLHLRRPSLAVWL